MIAPDFQRANYHQFQNYNKLSSTVDSMMYTVWIKVGVGGGGWCVGKVAKSWVFFCQQTFLSVLASYLSLVLTLFLFLQGRALIPTVKHERRDGSSSANPYMAFRKRTEKMQTRKVSLNTKYRTSCSKQYPVSVGACSCISVHAILCMYMC